MVTMSATANIAATSWASAGLGSTRYRSSTPHANRPDLQREGEHRAPPVLTHSCANKSSTSTGHPRLIAIPICWTFRSVFDTLDNIDKLAADINDAKTSLEPVDRILPQIITQLKLTADDSEALAALLVSTYGQADLQSTATDQTFDDL